MADYKRENEIILGRFVVVKYWLATSIVYLLRDRDDPSKQYIAKRVRPEYLHRQCMIDWFEREVRVWDGVTGHPYIVSLVHGSRRDAKDGVNYFFVEFINGKTLAEVIDDALNVPGRRLTQAQTLRWGTQVAMAMAHASQKNLNKHGQYVHRDLDAGNILTTREGAAKVNDWGLGKELEDADPIPFESLTDFTGLLGKVRSMPPELCPPSRGQNYGVAGDVYFWGGLIYQMLTGECVNPAPEARRIMSARSTEEVCRILRNHQAHIADQMARAGIMPGLVQLVMDCIDVDWNRRVNSFATVLERLAPLADDLRSGHFPEPGVICSRCSFVAAPGLRSCPVCDAEGAFRPYSVQQFHLDIEPRPAPAPHPVGIPHHHHPAPPPSEEWSLEDELEIRAKPQELEANELVEMQGGVAILGARQETVNIITQRYNLNEESAQSLAVPPERRVTLAAFRMARYAVSNHEYWEFTQATGWRQPAHWQKQKYTGKQPEMNNLPVVRVDFNDAEAFCQWKAVRLPRTDEWERAARGLDGRSYPWGHEWLAVSGEQPCNCLEHARENGQDVLSVASFPDSATPEGLFNLAGNVWEWTDGGRGRYKCIRGGSYQVQGDVYALPWMEIKARPELLDDDLGFRYAADLGAAPPEIAPPDLDALVVLPPMTYRLGMEPSHIDAIVKKFDLREGDAATLGTNEARTVDLPLVRIRKHPVTNEEYYQFVTERGYPWPANWSKNLESWSGRPFPARYKYHPVVHVSYRDALAFCAWRHADLPSANEWEAAARGADRRLYPWGNKFDIKHGNFSDSGAAGTTRVDAYKSGSSPCGCLDLAGNVWEWTGPLASNRHMVRGGAFGDSGPLFGISCLPRPADPDAHAADLGFRYVIR